MNKAFIFDFDGIIVNSEPVWQIENEVVFEQVYGSRIKKLLTSTVIGLSMEKIHQKALEYGSTANYADFVKHVNERCVEVYGNAPLTPGLQTLKDELDKNDFHLGIVSASAKAWIEIVLQRLNWRPSDFKIILSLNDTAEIAHKPAPDGYLHAIKALGASPETTLILEDSNIGIQSAKASGATVIGFKENLVQGYKQTGADLYAENIEEVLTLVKKFNTSLTKE